MHLKMAKENDKPLLQWRKIVGNKSSKGIPWNSPIGQERERVCHSCSKVSYGFSSQEKTNEAALNYRSDAMATKREVECNRIAEKKCHIVQTKKTKYSHLISSQKHVMPKEEENASPVVYKSKKYQGKKEVAVLWLQQFTVVDEN